MPTPHASRRSFLRGLSTAPLAIIGPAAATAAVTLDADTLAATIDAQARATLLAAVREATALLAQQAAERDARNAAWAAEILAKRRAEGRPLDDGGLRLNLTGPVRVHPRDVDWIAAMRQPPSDDVVRALASLIPEKPREMPVCFSASPAAAPAIGGGRVSPGSGEFR